MNIKILSEKVRAVDKCSFFVSGKLFDNLTKEDILKHNCFHLINVIAKIDLFLQNSHSDSSIKDIIINEVIPDILIYAFQFANAYEVNIENAYYKYYHQALGKLNIKLHKCNLDKLQEIQSKIDYYFINKGELLKVPTKETIIEHSLSSIISMSAKTARIADKHDHNTILPYNVLAEEVIPELLGSSFRLANYFKTRVITLFSNRLNDIMNKYGDVRFLDLSTPFII